MKIWNNDVPIEKISYNCCFIIERASETFLDLDVRNRFVQIDMQVDERLILNVDCLEFDLFDTT